MFFRLALGLFTAPAVRASPIPLFYINLRKVVNRNQYMQQRFGEFELYRVDAPPMSDPHVLEDWISPTDEYTWTHAHEGTSQLLDVLVTATHQAAIRMASDMGFDYAIFMEDDPAPWGPRQWMPTLERILHLVENDTEWRMIRLQYSNAVESRLQKILYAPGRPPIYAKPFMATQVWGAAAYLLNKDGMDYFLNKSTSVADGKFICPSAHCIVDHLLNVMYPHNQVVPIPGLMHWRFFEGSAGGRTGKIAKFNTHFPVHCQNLKHNAWHSALILERHLGYPPDAFLKQEWQLMVGEDAHGRRRK